MTVTLRHATPDDAPAIARIYAHYVDNTAITFETIAPTAGEMRERIRSTLGPYPYIVAETTASDASGEEGKVVGYAYAGQHMVRAAYGWNAVLSLYLDHNCRGGGIGSRLFRALLDLLTAQGYRNAYGIVTCPNEPSFRLHDRFGFSLAGTLSRSGFKNGRWHDVRWYEKRLGENLADSTDSAPGALIRLEDLPRDLVAKILGTNSL